MSLLKWEDGRSQKFIDDNARLDRATQLLVRGSMSDEDAQRDAVRSVARRPLYLVKHNEYFDESWHVLAAFTDRQLASQFISETAGELAKTFDTSVGDFDDWHRFTIQETVLHELK